MSKRFDIKAAWDAVWWGSNDELPLTTEAATLVSTGVQKGPPIGVQKGPLCEA